MVTRPRGRIYCNLYNFSPYESDNVEDFNCKYDNVEGFNCKSVHVLLVEKNRSPSCLKPTFLFGKFFYL